MKHRKTAPAAPETDADDGRWEIARQWGLAWRGLKWLVAGAVMAGALLVVGQIYLFHQLFADIHPWLGWGFVAAATAAFGWLIALPLARFFLTPAAARPPKIELETATPKDVRRRLAFDVTYLESMSRNPELLYRRAEIEQAIADARALKRGAPDAAAVARFQRARIEPLLADLDKKVEAYIHAEAGAVGATTAISMNGSIDAFIVLWRNVNMIARIARLYYGRPNLRASLLILRDVAGAVILSRALDDVTDMAGEAVGGVLGKLGGLVAGPLMDGSVNALMTLKLGYVAKRRCRAFEPWTEKRKRRVIAEVFERLAKESTGVVEDLVRRCKGAATAATGAASGAGDVALRHSRSAWGKVQDLFVKRPGSVPTDG